MHAQSTHNRMIDYNSSFGELKSRINGSLTSYLHNE